MGEEIVMLNSIKGKMMCIIGLLIIVLLTGSSTILYFEGRNVLKKSIFDDAVINAESNAEVVNNWLQGLIKQVQTLSKVPDVKSLQWNRYSDLLKNVAADNEYIELLFTANIDGDYNTTGDATGNISGRDYFPQVMGGKTVVSRPVINDATGNLVIVIASPVKQNNVISGLLGATVELKYLKTLVADMKIAGHGYGWIIDNKMQVLAHPEDEYLGRDDIFEGRLLEIAQQMINGEKGSGFYKFGGIEKGSAYAPIDVTGWSIAVTADSKKVLAPLDIIKRSSIYIAVISAIIGLIIAFFIARYISRPIQAVTEHAEVIASGDLTNSIPEVYLKRKDEIGRLTKAFKKMAVNLKNIISQVSDVSDHVAASSEELSASGDEVAIAAEQVGNAIQDVASGAEEQSAQVENTSNIINILTDDVDKIENLSREMNIQADKVMGSINDGDKYINLSIKQITEVKSNSNEVADTIDNLGESSTKIGKIIEMISGISDQTNLLALNAAIEAARAGEAGRGFSVVADEIRELAEESSTATEQIADLIKEIQSSVNNAVDNMETTEKVIDKSVNTIKSSGKSFAEINNVATRLKEIIETINDRTLEMINNSDRVKNAVKEIAIVSQEAASNSEEVSASSEEQVASTEEIVSAANELAEMAQQLSEAVKKFKV